MDLANSLRQRLSRTPEPPTVLELDLSRGVVTAAPTSPREALRSLHAPTLRGIRDGLRAAAEDDSVAGLIVHVADGLSITESDEIGRLLAAFGQHKPTLAHAASFGELTSGLAGYRLASHAHQVWLQPSGGLGLQGVSVHVTLLRGTLDKVGIEPEFAQRHEYKTAANQFTAQEVTAPQREMMQRIVDSVLAETIATVAHHRSLTPSRVDQAVADAPLTAEQALNHGLVDRVGYRDQVYAWARENWGRPSDSGPEVTLRYVHRWAREKLGTGLVQHLRDRRRPGIAVVGVTGPIVTGPSTPGGLGGQRAGSDTVAAHLRAAGADPQVKAVVLRVSSPGGSYVASDTIRREVLRLREQGRPVVAVMGDVAASGGYFVSMGADHVIAAPASLTGSIGVLAGKMVTSGLADRIGLVREEMSAGENAAMFSSLQGFSPAQRARLDQWLDEVYDDFTHKAAADRSMPYEALEAVARGRVWTGADALDHGLVDSLGGMDAALDRACALAGIERSRIAVRGVPGAGLLAQLRPAESSDAPAPTIELAAGGALDLMADLARTGGPEAMLTALAARAGLPVTGVLAMPYRMRLV